MGIPYWLNGRVDETGVEKIRSAVMEAEKKTTAEIVPMIVHRSITTGHVPVILLLGHLLVFWTMIPYLAPHVMVLPIWVWEASAIALSIVLTWVQKDLDFWQRLLTAKADMTESVDRRAELEFFESDIKSSEKGTGVLIFVSLLEHRAVVLADKAVAEKMPADVWEGFIQKLVSRIKAQDFTGGMVDAIAEAGQMLQAHFPAGPGDRNELPDHLVIKE